jgi:hypothetical protein
VQLTLKGTDGGQPFALVLGALGPVGGGGAATQTAEAWRNEAWARFRNLMSNVVVCTGATLRHVGEANALPFEVGPPPSPTGTSQDARAVAAASFLLKWNTATGGRSGRGRTFLPGLPAPFVTADGRQYTADARTSAQTVINAYIAAGLWEGQGLQPAVLSFRRGAAYPILSGSPSAIVGVQRRRMRA